MTQSPNPPPPPPYFYLPTSAGTAHPPAIQADITLAQAQMMMPSLPAHPAPVHTANASYAPPLIPQWQELEQPQLQQPQPPPNPNGASAVAAATHHEEVTMSMTMTTTTVHDAATTMIASAQSDRISHRSESTMPPTVAAAVAVAVDAAVCDDKRHNSNNNIVTNEEAAASLSQGIPFNLSDYPELQFESSLPNNNNGHDNATTTRSNKKLVRAFREPLFPKDPSPILAIAYSHRTASALEREHLQQQKKRILQELHDIKSEFARKKQDLLDVNSRLKSSSQKLGAWNRKVFDLELIEPGCAWNEKYASLQEYVATHNNKIPEHCHKLRGSGIEKQLASFIANQRSKMKRQHKSCTKYPHRYEALEKLGVHWESENDARFESMFAKLLAFKREHGTFRMPSLDLCKESGDEELIALHNWVFSQVGAFRYQLKTKKVELVKRFLDIGFSFEKWYGTNGHVFDRDIPPFDAICRRYVLNGGKIDEEDVQILNAAAEKNLKRGGGKKRKRRNDEMDESGAVVVGEEGDDAAAAAAATGTTDTTAADAADRASAMDAKIGKESMNENSMIVDQKEVESSAPKVGA